MKTYIKKTFAIIFSLLLIVAAMPMMSFAAVTPPSGILGDGGSLITINNIENGDTSTATRIIKSTYNPETNTVTREWANPAITEALVGITKPSDGGTFSNLTIDGYIDLNAADRKALLDGLKLVNGDITLNHCDESGNSVDTYNGAVNGRDYFKVVGDDAVTPGEDGSQWGSFLIVTTEKGTAKYETMAVNVEPIGDGSTWSVPNATVEAKKILSLNRAILLNDSSSPSDTANDEIRADSEDIIKYTVDMPVPQYNEGVTGVFNIVTNTTAGITPAFNSLKVYGVDEEGGNPVELALNTNYIYTKDEQAQTATIDFASAYSTVEDYEMVRVSYYVTVDATDAVQGNNGGYNDETATIDGNVIVTSINYQDPYGVQLKSAKDDLEIITNRVKLVNTDDANYLTGSEFQLLKDLGTKPPESGTVDVDWVKDADKYYAIVGTVATDGVSAGTEVTGTYRSDIDFDGNQSDYYVRQTVAAPGYHMLKNLQPVAITDQDGHNLITISSTGSAALLLPSTGGIGTTIFTVVGISLMGGSLLLLGIMRRRKSQEQNSRGRYYK